MMAPEDPRYEEQVAFDGQLREAVELDLEGFGPDLKTLSEHLEARGLVIDGYRLRS